MPQHGSPVSGFTQPDNGSRSVLASQRMARPTKVVTPKDIIGQILIDNVTARWEKAFPRATTDKARLEALASRSGAGKETLRMMMKGERSPRIDTVDKVARALGTSAAELLTVCGANNDSREKVERPFKTPPNKQGGHENAA